MSDDTPSHENDAAADFGSVAIIEVQRLLELFGKEKLHSLYITFREEATEILAEISTALENENAELIQQNAHRLKGACGVFRFTTVMMICAELESQAKGSQWQEAKATLALLSEKFEEIDIESIFSQAKIDTPTKLTGSGRILIVEDSPTQAVELQLVLESAGYCSEIVGDGTGAYRLFSTSDFDLILADVIMPGISGYEFCRKIKMHPKKGSTPVILLTALNSLRDLKEGMRCGAENFIVKPYDPEHLLQRIKRVLQRQEHREPEFGNGRSRLFRNLPEETDQECMVDYLVSTLEEFLHSRDMESRSRLEEANRRAELSLQREQFIAALTHDLKNPLIAANRILTVLLNGKGGKLSAEQYRLLKLVTDSNHELLEMVHSLLDVYRYEAQEFVFSMKPVNVDSIAQACVEQFSELAASRGVEIVYQDCKNCRHIQGDSVAIRRLISNLLGNAIAHSHDGGRINIALRPQPDSLVLTVADTGTGISQADQKYLFKKYANMGQRRTLSVSIGLGLYLCAQIVKAHNGEIACASELGHGTTFTVCLPLRLKSRANSRGAVSR